VKNEKCKKNTNEQGAMSNEQREEGQRTGRRGSSYLLSSLFYLLFFHLL
jgi:hypothetical protein